MYIATRLRSFVAITFFLLLLLAIVLVVNYKQLNQSAKKNDSIRRIYKKISELNMVAHNYYFISDTRSLSMWNSREEEVAKLLSNFQAETIEEQIILKKIQYNLNGLASAHYLLRNEDDGHTYSKQMIYNHLLIKIQNIVSGIAQVRELKRLQHERIQKSSVLLLAVGVIVSAILITVNALIIIRRVSGPLKRLLVCVEAVGKGDFSHTISNEYEDEIGDLARAFEKMKNDLALLTVSRDELNSEIEEKKKTEKALIESHDRFQTLFDNAPLSYQSLDEHGRILEVNQTWQNEMGYTKDEVIGKSFGDFFSGAWKDHFKKKFKELKISGEVSGAEFELVKKDGSTALMSFKGKVGRFDNGSFEQTHCVFHDVSEQKRMEEQLRQAQKMEVIGTMAGGIAHDFNNILAIILGNAELSLDVLPAINPARESLEEIMGASRRARDLVRQILTFCRKEQREMIPLRPASMIKETLKLLRSTTPTTVSIIQIIADETDEIMADPSGLHQLLMNLFTNAVHAVDEKGEITISLEEVTLDYRDLDQLSHLVPFSTAAPGRYARLSVSDTGTGMDTATLKRIFDPFYTTKEIGKGTGLGLSVVHGIVESHEGFMTVESARGNGSVFRVFLPVTTHDDHDMPVARLMPFAATGTEHILLIDDETALLAIAQRLLESLGYAVTAESDSLKALEMFKAKPNDFDLIITDQAMPDISGLELVDKIRLVRPEIPIVLCTGYSTKISEESAHEKGINKYVAKPYDKKILSETIREVLNQKVSAI